MLITSMSYKFWFRQCLLIFIVQTNIESKMVDMLKIILLNVINPNKLFTIIHAIKTICFIFFNYLETFIIIGNVFKS